MSVNDLAQTDDVLAYAAALLSPPTFAESSKSPAVPPLAVGVGLDMGGGEIVELARPERRRARVSRAHAASIAARRNLWPREFRQCRSHAITLRFTERTDRPPVRVEIRWREGRGFAAMAVGLGVVAQGESQSRALASVIRLLDPEIETVHDEEGQRLA